MADGSAGEELLAGQVEKRERGRHEDLGPPGLPKAGKFVLLARYAFSFAYMKSGALMTDSFSAQSKPIIASIDYIVVGIGIL